MSRREADMTKGIEQCPYSTPHGDDGYLRCRFEVNHDGDHDDCYDTPNKKPSRWWCYYGGLEDT